MFKEKLSKGLIIKEPWVNMILDGTKTMEIRGCRTTKRERVGTIKSGTKKVFGAVEIIDCIELNKFKFEAYRAMHKVECNFEDLPYKKVFGWFLDKPRTFKKPVPYKHKLGCVIWANLNITR